MLFILTLTYWNPFAVWGTLNFGISLMVDNPFRFVLDVWGGFGGLSIIGL